MRLYTSKMGDNTKQVRVDNWGIFFLQRLQMFFSKTDYCDMTLQFEGNVQLKVHRLVMNACTEYFQFLEQTCMVMEENVIMMPSDLQADVIVPIVNFMYTGMLEFHFSLYERLYKTAELMNITILMKLLDAQKQPTSGQGGARGTPSRKGSAVSNQHNTSLQAKRTPAKSSSSSFIQSELPATLPGRKLPVWKRKSVQLPSPSFGTFCSEPRRGNAAGDPLSLTDNTPKPTRFEWPDDDLPIMNMMDTSFEEISYTSKPLLTKQEDAIRASTSFDDLKHQTTSSRSGSSTSLKKPSSSDVDMEEMKNYVKEQKIRSGLTSNSGGGGGGVDGSIVVVGDGDGDGIVDIEIEDYMMNESIAAPSLGQKRKLDLVKSTGKILTTTSKKVRYDEQDNKATVNISADGKTTSGDLNHTKIVSEILKKYPQLVRKNKNIRLKIMATNKPGGAGGSPVETKIENIQIRSSQPLEDNDDDDNNTAPVIIKSRSKKSINKSKDSSKSPWVCETCAANGDPVEFVLYYLYRKHLTDVHSEKVDPRLCKYCGHKCNKQDSLMYHLYIKHGLKPPGNYNFPKCDRCPYIASSDTILNKHKLRHCKDEMQCVECKLTFSCQATLTTHVQITGHMHKATKNNYDCQYCTKRLHSTIELFNHVKLQHYNDGIRDGIVSIDESEDGEESDEQDDDRDEYILPERITNTQKEKVKILSNVKMPSNSGTLMRTTDQRNITLEPSSEAEALSNVASGIATSLGLVDIVVLDENQQFVLQSRQQNFTTNQNDDEQHEFILPELGDGETYTTDGGDQTEDHQVISQSLMASGDIGSTDELVMVLTDHDYGDNQDDIISNDNSNIVVLYSHPVDGQQEQFITSQGNIMLNSQTGVIEIHNGTTTLTTTTSPSSLSSSTTTLSSAVTTTTTTNNNDITIELATNDAQHEETQIESIELIQREIESHSDLKQDFDTNKKPEIVGSTMEKQDNLGVKSMQEIDGDDDAMEEECCDNSLLNTSFIEDEDEQLSSETSNYLMESAKDTTSVVSGDGGVVDAAESAVTTDDVDDVSKTVDVNEESTLENEEPSTETSNGGTNFDKETVIEMNENAENPSSSEKNDSTLMELDDVEDAGDDGKCDDNSIVVDKESAQDLPNSATLEIDAVPSTDTDNTNNDEEDSSKTNNVTTTGTQELLQNDKVIVSNDSSTSSVVVSEEVAGKDCESSSVLIKDEDDDEKLVDAFIEAAEELNKKDENNRDLVEEQEDKVDHHRVESLEDADDDEKGIELSRLKSDEESEKKVVQDEKIKDEDDEDGLDPNIPDMSLEDSSDAVVVVEDNSQSSRGSQEIVNNDVKKRLTVGTSKGNNNTNHSTTTKTSILDDWDDTDSQQSTSHNNKVDDNNEKVVGDETVNKLMDDWEDEEDDDGGNNKENN